MQTIFALLFSILALFCAFKAGYNVREKLFQEKPITFTVKEEKAVRVDNVRFPFVDILVYKKNLVNITYIEE